MISHTLPAVRVSTNGRKVFFNQVIAAYTGWVDKRNQLGQAVTFSDGSTIPHEFIQKLEAFLNSNSSVYEWEDGQFVIVDNTVAQHSREPFVGRRQVLACIANGIRQPHQE